MSNKIIASLKGIMIMAFLCQCSSSGSGDGPGESSLIDSSVGYQSWPNESTTDTSVNYITSKILVSDLDQNGELENIFISELRFSSNKKSSVLRVTKSAKFKEVSNFKSNNIYLLKDSHPFAYDLNKDGDKEILFVSYDRDEIYAIDFKNKNLKKLYLRWRLSLPEPLPEDFDRNFKIVVIKEKKMIKIGPYGVFEKKNKKPALINL